MHWHEMSQRTNLVDNKTLEGGFYILAPKTCHFYKGESHELRDCTVTEYQMCDLTQL